MQTRREHIERIIKEHIDTNTNPYIKCFIVPTSDCPEATASQVQSVCDSLMDELGFRFKLDFQPEYCLFKALKIPDKDEFRKQYNYARAQS